MANASVTKKDPVRTTPFPQRAPYDEEDLREVSEALSGAVVVAERKVGGTDMVILEYRGGKS